jgi:hypothetical protein
MEHFGVEEFKASLPLALYVVGCEYFPLTFHSSCFDEIHRVQEA